MKNKLIIIPISLFLIIGFLLFSNINLITKQNNITAFPYENYFLEKHKGYIDQDRKIFFKAATQESNKFKTRNSSLPWQQEGPLNVGGRINCIALQPNNSNTFLIGTADGGIFKSTNGGSTYTPIFDNAAALAISCIVYAADNNSTIYAGTGDQVMGGFSHMGNGIYKSTDGGATWSNIGLSNTGCITKIIVDSTNPSILYAATTGIPFLQDNNRGVYKSINGGTTWTQILYLGNTAGIGDLVIHPTNNQILYATGRNRFRSNINSIITGPAARIYKSSNGGATWDTLTNGLPTNTDNCRIGLAISKTNPAMLYALYVDNNLDFGGVYKTTNNGLSWTQVSSASTNISLGGFGWYFGNIILDPYNNNNIFIHAIELYKSTDAGINWNTVSNTFDVHADKHAQVFLGNSNSYLLGTDGGLYKTTNGNSFATLNNFPITQFYRVSYSPFDTTYYFGGAQDNGSNQGNIANISNWTRYFGGDGFKTVFHPTDPNTFYAEWQNGNIVATDDGGFNWYYIAQDLTNIDAFWWDTPYFMSHANPDNIYTASYRVFKNTTGVLATWDTISTDLTDGVNTGGFHFVTSLAQNNFEAQKLYAGTNDGNLWRTDNDGTTWVNLNASPLPDRFVTGITPSPNNSNNVYVCYSGYRLYDSSPYLFKSTNNGTSFVSIAGNLPSFCINDIYVQKGHADSNIVVATDGGVYFTKDAGNTWARVGNNMPIIPVYDIDYNPYTKMLFAGTFARSMQSYPMDSLFSKTVVGFPASTTNTFASEEVQIFPSLANEAIQIVKSKTLPMQVNIFNTEGKKLYTFVQSENKKTFSTQVLPAGNYIVSYSIGNTKGQTKITIIH